MVNGSSMLSSTPSSLLLSTALPTLSTASGAGEGQAASPMPGFAELLSNLSQNGSGTAASEVVASTALPGESVDAPGLPGFADLFTTLPLKLRGATKSEALPGDSALPRDANLDPRTAMAATAASPAGKILPVALPEAAGAETAKVVTSDTQDAPSVKLTNLDTNPAAAGAEAGKIATPDTPEAPSAKLTDIDIDIQTALAPLAGLAQQLPELAEKPHRVAADIARAVLPQAALALSAKPVGKASPAPAKEAAPATAVAITVATKTEAATAPTAIATAAAEIAASAPAKPQRGEPIRAEAPLQPVLHAAPSTATAVDAAPAPSAQTMPVATAPAAMPSSADINAALDRLVAAREALMPAEAALAVEHAEFGEISIRFEQGSDGRLSAELRAADPELHRAVTAAVGADRGMATGSDADGARPSTLAQQRGSATGGEAASGERSQPGQERDTNQRRGTGRSATGHEGKNDPRPGVFA